jgi:hypothetical protein
MKLYLMGYTLPGAGAKRLRRRHPKPVPRWVDDGVRPDFAKAYTRAVAYVERWKKRRWWLHVASDHQLDHKSQLANWHRFANQEAAFIGTQFLAERSARH